MKFSQNIELDITMDNALILDGQSRILNWLYNHCLQKSKDELEAHKNDKNVKLTFASKHGLRDYMVNEMKTSEEYKFLSSVYSKPLKESADRCENALKQYYKDYFGRKNGTATSKVKRGFPKFRSWRAEWFSIYYDEANVGYKIEGDKVRFTLGTDENGNRLYADATLKEPVKKGKVKTLRICKNLGKYYVNLSMETEDRTVDTNAKRWVSIDQNHKNFFCAIDHNGGTIEFEYNKICKYFDEQIDKVKSKRDKVKKFLDKDNKKFDKELKYKVYTKKYAHLTNTIKYLYQKRREQIKTFLNSVACFLYENYDIVIIGDYTPTVELTKSTKMRRSMLNQSFISKFRQVLKHHASKNGKVFVVKSEVNTTKHCPYCGRSVKKSPDIREYICKGCSHKIIRDIGSCMNIGYEEIINLSGTDYFKTLDTSVMMYGISYSYQRGIAVRELNDSRDWGSAKVI